HESIDPRKGLNPETPDQFARHYFIAARSQSAFRGNEGVETRFHADLPSCPATDRSSCAPEVSAPRRRGSLSERSRSGLPAFRWSADPPGRTTGRQTLLDVPVRSLLALRTPAIAPRVNPRATPRCCVPASSRKRWSSRRSCLW